MTDMSQAEIIAFLSDGANLRGHAPVKVIRTHGAIVFLSGKDAYKIKRDVRYDYLDFSTLQKRRAMLLRELELNAVTAPSIYRDVIAVTRDAAGRLRLGGEGEVVEWVLRMRRFEAADELDKVAGRGALDDAVADALGTVVARYHAQTASRVDLSGSGLIGAVLEQLNTAFAKMTPDLGADLVSRFRSTADRVFHRAVPILETRANEGHVRRCHGDLHLRNIVLIDGTPMLFDALEFDETLGTCDVLYDLAFLLMDLRHEGLYRAAGRVLNSYLFHANDMAPYAGLALLPLFQSLRAGVRAMVAVQAARLDPNDDRLLPGARAYLREALAYLDPAPARLIAIGGRSGTGKTVLAASLAHQIGAPPGAVHLRSDLERKALCGVSPLTRLPESAYDPEVSARVHDAMRTRARVILSAGHSVILDATWLNRDERARLPDLARDAGAGFTGIWLRADTAVLERRVSTRIGDASDADASVVRRQVDPADDPASWLQIDASGDKDTTCTQAQRLLSDPSDATDPNTSPDG